MQPQSTTRRPRKESYVSAGEEDRSFVEGRKKKNFLLKAEYTFSTKSMWSSMFVQEEETASNFASILRREASMRDSLSSTLDTSCMISIYPHASSLSPRKERNHQKTDATITPEKPSERKVASLGNLS